MNADYWNWAKQRYTEHYHRWINLNSLSFGQFILAGCLDCRRREIVDQYTYKWMKFR